MADIRRYDAIRREVDKLLTAVDQQMLDGWPLAAQGFLGEAQRQLRHLEQMLDIEGDIWRTANAVCAQCNNAPLFGFLNKQPLCVDCYDAAKGASRNGHVQA